MRSLFLLFVLTLALRADGQQGDSLYLRASVATNRSSAEPHFTLWLKNISKGTAKAPIEFVVTAKKAAGANIWAEVIYLGGQSSKLTILDCHVEPEPTIQEDGAVTLSRDGTLAPEAEVKREVSVGCFSFDRKGPYKVRFHLLAKSGVILTSSKWLPFRVAK